MGVSIEKRTQQIGAELLTAARALEPAPTWSDRLMRFATADEAVKVELFRFVDVFPVLTSPEQVYQHLQEYLLRPGLKPPAALAWAITAGRWAKPALSRMAASQIKAMGGRFIGGSDAADALPRLRKHWDAGVGFSVDLLGEACVSEAEAAAYRQRYMQIIETLAGAVTHWPNQAALEHDHLGAIPRANVSIKISSLVAKVDPMDFERTVDRLTTTLEPILTLAGKHHVLVNFDVEQQTLKDLTLAVFMRCCEQIDFPAGLAMQAYLRSGEADAKRIIDWARRANRIVTVRLVKGAYWDYEGITAEMNGWPEVVWDRKSDTDACFERMTKLFVDAAPRRLGKSGRGETGGVKLALGSHNARSIAHGLALVEAAGLPSGAIELQMLYGMADGLKRAVVKRGLRLREYVPVGEMIPGMAYLVRRLLENTSNASWLKAGFEADTPPEVLLTSPHDTPRLVAPHALSKDHDGFVNEPQRDFSDRHQREYFAAAVATGSVEDLGSPLSGVANDATIADAHRAIQQAQQAFPAWRDMDAVKRAKIITDAAALMRARRDELAGIIVHEAGKPWRHADADVCEAIDFCEYYARQSIVLFQPKRLGQFAGELNEQWHQARGVAAVISPWNFPLAICCGMTVAALVTGNTAIVKPAEQTPIIAQRMCELLWQAGVPREVLHYLPGIGETVGAALVRDPRVALICFTGSKAVGLDIIRAAGNTDDRQAEVKKVVCEMGGKNAIIIDESADLDEAVVGVRDSAFGYAGQRCSACSRVIVVEAVYDRFVQRLVEATRSLVVGDAANPAVDVPPVIDEQAAEKIRQYIAIGETEAKLALMMDQRAGVATSVAMERQVGGEGSVGVSKAMATEVATPGSAMRGVAMLEKAAPNSARLIGPAIFTDVPPTARIAREEIFGPVLAVIRARDFDHALELANDSAYRLTGGVYSRTPSHLARARQKFHVGNLYLNRSITGALVARQPFGGFGMSGLGSKAGGDEYLHHFVVLRSCAENTMRRGFAPGFSH